MPDDPRMNPALEDVIKKLLSGGGGGPGNLDEMYQQHLRGIGKFGGPTEKFRAMGIEPPLEAKGEAGLTKGPLKPLPEMPPGGPGGPPPDGLEQEFDLLAEQGPQTSPPDFKTKLGLIGAGPSRPPPRSIGGSAGGLPPGLIPEEQAGPLMGAAQRAAKQGPANSPQGVQEIIEMLQRMAANRAGPGKLLIGKSKP